MRFKVEQLAGVSIDNNNDAITFTFTSQGDSVLNLSVPLGQLPPMFVLMNDAWARAVAARDGQPTDTQTLVAVGQRVLDLNNPDAIAMILALEGGMEVAFQLSDELGEGLRRGLSEAL